jgi:hypothetical protein
MYMQLPSQREASRQCVHESRSSASPWCSGGGHGRSMEFVAGGLHNHFDVLSLPIPVVVVWPRAVAKFHTNAGA